MNYELINAVDADKVDEIAQSMLANGWQGAPVVVWDDTLITGSHRVAAIKQLDGAVRLETIDLQDVVAEAGLDWDELMVEFNDLFASYSLQASLNMAIFNLLPESIVEKYGVQWR